jgi:hypothetical protein
VNIEELVALSHSIDDSAALEQILIERVHNSIKRFLGVIDMDGSLFGSVAFNPSLADLYVPSLCWEVRYIFPESIYNGLTSRSGKVVGRSG